ncbi:MAG TPA: hypothetical protein VNK52_04015 [Hyphomicrobiaceae bacterium]|nr:hypothetical protein [Hyphomicrobiaceae bacterium]
MRPPKDTRDDQPDDAMERADKAIKELLRQKPETHEEMVERRRKTASRRK